MFEGFTTPVGGASRLLEDILKVVAQNAGVGLSQLRIAGATVSCATRSLDDWPMAIVQTGAGDMMHFMEFEHEAKLAEQEVLSHATCAA